ncbi:MAG TPA: NADP-dependent oxidoreductase [Candidatus Acidoferrales bacterium]|nr:NADP-dependent oxidoreductase [Candidatus Acidoferrales bacterium]
MKALIVDNYGPPQAARIGEIDKPPLKDGSLLVKIHAAGINPFDYKLITGVVKDFMPISFPHVPGMDGAGVVDEIGQGVQGWRKGDAVLGMFDTGTLAEYALISAHSKRLARKPDPLDFVRAAAIPEAGLTATTIVRAADVRQGQTVFVIGATGGLGLFIIQLAKSRGARLIATGKATDAEYLRRLGADDVIDYGAGDALQQVRQRYPSGVDVVVDVINSGDTLLRDAEVMRQGGTLVSSLSGPEQSAFPSGITVHYIQLKAKDGDLEDIARRAASGDLHVEISGTYAFAEAAQAFVDLYDPAKHTRGKLVVKVVAPAI